MSDKQTNKPAVISPGTAEPPDTKNHNSQHPDDASEGVINLNKSEEAEKVKETGITPNKGEQDGGAGS